MYKNCFKRLIDISISFIGLALLAIPMLAVAAIVKADSKGAVLFGRNVSAYIKQHS